MGVVMLHFSRWQCSGVSPREVDSVPVLTVVILDIEQQVIPAQPGHPHKHLLEGGLEERISQTS